MDNPGDFELFILTVACFAVLVLLLGIINAMY
jgi:hypothetical protein